MLYAYVFYVDKIKIIAHVRFINLAPPQILFSSGAHGHTNAAVILIIDSWNFINQINEDKWKQQ